MDSIVCKNCGSINDYTIQEKSNNSCAYCNGCGKFIKNVPKNNTKGLRFYLGKYNQGLISDCADLNYLEWMIKSVKMKPNYVTAIENQIKLLKENGK